MENTLIAIITPTDDDILQLEALHDSIVNSKTFEIPEVSPEGSDPSFLEIQKQKNLLNIMIQKCFEKIRTDKNKYDICQKEMEDLQLHINKLQDENNYLSTSNQEAFDKITQLEYILDEVEADNEKLHAEVVQYKNEKKDLEVCLENQRRTLRKESSLNASGTEPQNLNTSTHSNYKESKRKDQAEINFLKDTVNVQNETIDQLHSEIDKFESMMVKYDSLKHTLTSLLNAKFSKPSISLQERSISEDKALSNRGDHLSNDTPPKNGQASIVEETDGEEHSNRNHLVAKRNSLTKNNAEEKTFHRQNSLTEDILGTETSNGHKKGWSCTSLNNNIEGLSKSSRRDYMASKKTAASLLDVENDKYETLSMKEGGNSDTDENLYNRRIEDMEDDTSHREKVTISWLDGETPKNNFRNVESPLSVRSRRSPKKLKTDRTDSGDMKENELMTTNGETEGKPDSYETSGNQEGYIRLDEKTKTGDMMSFSFGKFETRKDDDFESKQTFKKLNKQVGAYLKKQKGAALSNTRFSVTGVIRALVFGTPKAH